MAAFTSVHVAPGLPELRAPAMVLAALEANFCGAMPAHGARQLVLVRSIDGRPQAITNELANADGRYIVALAPQPDVRARPLATYLFKKINALGRAPWPNARRHIS